jgi:hypothetical protein
MGIQWKVYPQGDETYCRRLEKFLLNTKADNLYGDWNDNGRLLQNGNSP